jgi:hypothetical protein
MNRNYTHPTVDPQWATARETHPAVAAAIHAIADSKRSPEAIWEAPTLAEFEHVRTAVHEYVSLGAYEFDPAGYAWGQETVTLPTYLTLNAQGVGALREILITHGRGGDDLAAWADDIESALNNRSAGESWSIELDGVRDYQGYCVFFNPDESEVEINLA